MIITADVVDDAGDAEWPGEAQQVCHEAVSDAEEQRASKSLPQSVPYQPWASCRDHASLLHHTHTNFEMLTLYQHRNGTL